MKINTSFRSPNFTSLPIQVEFVVIHYTAATLQRTLDIFMDKAREVSAHLVIDLDGSVYEVVPCLSGEAMRAWHAGKSRLEIVEGGKPRTFEGFNDCSIGIELVNLNGNLFSYTEAQYASLCSVMERLKGYYPALRRPESVLGHEHIAGFRGKCDPGRCFEWDRFYSVSYHNQGAPGREPLCSGAVADGLRNVVSALGVSRDAGSGAVTVPQGIGDVFFSELSRLCETVLSKDKP